MKDKDLFPASLQIVIESPDLSLRVPNTASSSWLSGADLAEAFQRSTAPEKYGLTAEAEPVWNIRNDLALNITQDALFGLIDRLAVSNADGATVRPARIHQTQLDDVVQLHLEADRVLRDTPDRPTGRGVTIAVIDSGIDATHDDFAGRIHPMSRSFVPGHDYDRDVYGHGTHVAGILAGSGSHYTGIAPEATLLILRVFDDTGRADEGSVAAAVRYAVEQGADIINFSGGYAPVEYGVPLVDPPWVWRVSEMKEEREIRRAFDNGVVSVVSAGNYGRFGFGTISCPATSPHAIAVGSITKQRTLSSFSSRGPTYRCQDLEPADHVVSKDELSSRVTSQARPHLVAIGGEVDPAAECPYMPGVTSAYSRSTTNTQEACLVRTGREYCKMSGTSQAAPVVAGLAALVTERLAELGEKPTTSAARRRRAQLVRRLLLTSTEAIAVKNRTRTVGNGIPTWRVLDRRIREIVNGSP
jgi:subtilisin family serine protease